ncbi:hypothetical protein [Streptacidiphilus sp. EB129]|uniref:hypothetical protein n=1 Tax=Streptacidiphilus sp. EB129 TaxID=3156262 RepID=UPI003519627C
MAADLCPQGAAAVLAGGKVLVKANLSKDATEVADLQAYDQATGTSSWTYPGVAALDVSHVRVAGNRVVMREELRTALVIDPATGTKTGEFGGNQFGAQVIVVENTNGSTVYTWGLVETPGVGWTMNDPVGIAAWDSVAGKLGADLLLVPAAGGADGFWAINASDGSVRWRYSEPVTRTDAWMVAEDPTGTLVAARQGNTLVALPPQ